MERIREARRGSMAAVNGVLSRRRQRRSSLRDSPEDDGGGGGVELHDGATRLRERASTSKKERDRERSSRSSKRRRGDRAVHGSGAREEGEDSSEESVDDDDEDDYEEAAVAAPPPQQTVRLPPAPSMPPPSASLQNPSPPNHHNHHSKKGIVAKVPRAPAVWKVADEMIGVSVPRKARTASAKRSPECWVSGSGGGGGAGAGGGGGGGGVAVDAAVHRQPSTSPARPSPSSSAPISPSSSNASIRKKLQKPSSGNKHRLPKISKSQPSSVQDIEFEVAEVLFGMTRQFSGPPKPEVHKSESKEALNGSSHDAKSRVSSPSLVPTLAISAQPPVLPLPNMAPLPSVVAPKRKRPRPAKLEEENPQSLLPQPVANSSISPPSKKDMEHASRVDGPVLASKSEKMQVLAVENGTAQLNELRVSHEALLLTDVQKKPPKVEVVVASESKPLATVADAADLSDVKEDAASVAVKPPSLLSDVKLDEESDTKVSAIAESPGKEKFQIDLMAPPPGKPSAEDEAMDEIGADYKAMVPEEKDKKVSTLVMEEEKKDGAVKPDGAVLVLESKTEVKSTLEEIDSRKLASKERMFDLHLEMPKQEKDETSSSRQPHSQKQQQLLPKPKTESKSDKPGWHGGLPPFGYMGQVPSLVPVDGSGGSAKPMQAPQVLAPPQRPKRCATHCYIAQCVQYHQQLQQLSRFWPAAGANAFYGAKPQYNVNGLQPSESAVAILGNAMQGGGFPGRNIGPMQDMGSPVVAAAFGGLPSKDKNTVAGNTALDSSQRKQQLVLQQTPQGVAANSMLAPAFVFPFNQQQAVAAAAAALNRPGATKAGNGSSASAPSTAAPAGPLTAPASGAAAMSFNYASLPETPYVAILQNNGYTFPIPAAHVGAPPQFRGNHPQAMPFFNNSFYTSQMLHPAQLQQQALPPQQSQQPVPSQQQGHQNKSTSSGSSSSQKHQQQRAQSGVGLPAGSAPASHGLPTMKLPQHLSTGRAVETETGGEDAPSSADSRVLVPPKGMYSHNFTMPVHPQNFTLMPTTDKQTHMPLSSQSSPSQAFTVSFPSLNGVTPSLGIDFSASQNHPLFHNIPEAARQGYQMVAAAAAASQAAQQKKTEGKSTAEAVAEETKTMLTTKGTVNFSQHSLAFAPSSPSLSSATATEASGRTLNLIPPPSGGGGRSSNRPSSAAPSSTAAGAINSFNAHQQQQQSHVVQQLQRQQQQQQQILMQNQLASRSKSTAPTTSSASLYTSAVPKFSNPLGGFPQAVVVQSGAAAAVNQSNQWKNASRSAAPVPIHSQSQPSISSSIKTQISQQHGRASQSALPNQTQISFSVAAGAGSSQKLPPQSGQLLPVGNAPGNPSPQSSLSKGGGGNGGGSGSPRSATVNKQGPPPPSSLPLQQQQQSQQSKSSPATSSHKSSPITNRNAPSILGQPHIPLPQSLGSKQQQQLEQLQHFQQAQLYFSGAYMQVPPQAGAGYLQRQQQQPNSTISSGMLSLGSPAVTHGSATATTESGKSAATQPPSMKNMPPQNLLQAAQLAATAGGAASQRPLMSAPGFSYMHGVSSVSVKPADQKPATGSDNLHACWQPEKR